MRITPLVTTIILFAVSLDRSDAIGQMLGPNFNSAIQLVVLKNGETFRGHVSRKADQVIVETIQGSRIVLSSEQTDFVCNSMEEAYWGKSARTRASDTAGQKALFHWCLKNQLMEQAQNQIDILSESDIKAADLEFIDRQMNVAILQQRNERQQLAKRSTQDQPNRNQSNPKSTSPGRFALLPIKVDTSIGVADLETAQLDTSIFRPLPSITEDQGSDPHAIVQHPKATGHNVHSEVQPTIQQVGFNEPIELEAASPNARDASKSEALQVLRVADTRDDRIMTSIAELEREMRELPKGSVGNYRQRVERALTVGCSAAKCHGSNSKVMPLLHRGLSQTIPLRQSQRNLHNVLKYVDRQNPFESSLLIAATTAHAGKGEPIIARATPNYQHLMQWLISISDDPARASAQESYQDPSDQRVASDPTKLIRPVKPAPAGLQPLGESPVQIPTTIGEIPDFNSQESGFTPVDPFDPEIFNRKYGGK